MAVAAEDDEGRAPRRGWALRPATLEDVEEIAFAELELFPEEAWNVFQVAAEIEHPDRRYVIAAAGEEAERGLIGYAGIMLAGDTADLHTIGTRRPGEGIGRALLGWCEEQARSGGAARLLLEVREDNDRARAFYTTAGYEEIGRRRAYYRVRDGYVDAIVMQREL
ncbi:GNAT family N-acetyltransferase [Brachybacterium sp. J153]|uniref:GNAT family N-acetyltransferase n=1 Tax=Brachybacterium sp. J153 TaxID=3116488 RepID=UPI002E77D715|nr:GNAT family N-acetyltransferase [Brachybacterium sp. J153]MEE1618263.1 GNAT family N-acetyltransferase [Brachybacterium sp. J153]